MGTSVAAGTHRLRSRYLRWKPSAAKQLPLVELVGLLHRQATNAARSLGLKPFTVRLEAGATALAIGAAAHREAGGWTLGRATGTGHVLAVLPPHQQPLGIEIV